VKRARVNQRRRASNLGPRPMTQHSEPSTQNQRILRAAVIVLAAAIVYTNSLSAPFIFDDQYSVVENPAIRSLAAARSQPHNTPLAGRPVAALTFAINYAASELDPAVYRATNVAIHIACALLLFGIVRRTLALPKLTLFGSAANDLAMAAALLWVVHPLTTDAVTYITQRTESLMALFYLATLYASLRAQSSGHGWAWTIAAGLACALGMGSKESMATAPLVVVLFDRVFLFHSVRDAFRARWRLYFGLALTWVILAFQLASTPRANSAGFETDVSVWTYLLNQAVMIVRYLRLVFWPVDLVINYGPPVAYTLADVIPQAAIVIALILATVGAVKWSPAAAFLAAWFFITLAPSSSFVPIATEVGAERRMYLPLMAVITGIVIGLYGWRGLRVRTSRAMAAGALAIVAVAVGAATIRRNAEHQSWLTLAQTTVERWPTDAAYAGVGGELARLRRDEEALPLLRVAARTEPRARYNLGITLFNLKHYDEAIRELDVLVGKFPMREEVPWARKVMGHAYLRLSKWPDAIAQLQMVLVMTPHDAEARRLLVDAYNSYGVDFAQAERFDEAIAEFRHALDLDDRNASARYNLATALFDKQQLAESFLETEHALALDPANADAHHLAGKLLALQGRMNEAIAHLETAVKLRPDDPVIRDDLGRVQRATP
jgi:protein O-mannosyl-transferase